ncbi:coiled-coil and C2 domain-containing protein 2A-like isoform X2 [Cylas formicarius]|uniref:coiled-coil and C2 domain-containing protein 2A-like isoform X2 n=1 Tax=Cylas formicarius TaxID=197179 RepID=UPI0029587F13|nr:coiled-coil and C2 domain-containing protein 2A-like isoform X2 [Cylas formicarius]
MRFGNMYGPKEQLIEMQQLPLNKTKSTDMQIRNKIYSSSHASPSNTFEKDLSTVFSDKSSIRKGHFREDAETISEISDAIFTTERSGDVSISENFVQSYRDKILQRFNAVKEQAKMSQKIQNISRRDARKRSIENIIHEVSKIGANMKSARSKTNQTKNDSNKEFAFFHFRNNNGSASKDIQQEEDLRNTFDNKEPMIEYIMPDLLDFNIRISERECYFFPGNRGDSTATVNEMPRILEGEGLCINLKNPLPMDQLNKLEERLIFVDDRTWFSHEGILDIVPNPTINECLKPEIQVKIDDGIILRAPTIENDLEKIIIIKENILKLSLFSLKFSYHPLFSAEHVLEDQLRSAYQTYTSFLENNTLQKLRNQLQVLKHTRKFEDKIVENNQALNEIIILTDKIFKEGKRQRQYLKTTLELWKTIKKLRQKQNYCNTRVKLLIFIEKVDANLEKENRAKMLMEMLDDILKNEEELFKRKLKEYSKKIECGISRANEGLENTPSKPVYDIDTDKIKYELQKKFEESFKPTGEPNLTLMLTDENEITNDVVDKQEISRRKAVTYTKILFKLSCNKVPVAKSKILRLNDDFLLNINEEFYIQLTDIPDHINLDIVEYSKGIMKRKLCELEIPLPPQGISEKKESTRKLTFENDEFARDKQGVGSALNLKNLFEENKLFLKTNSVENMTVSGYLSYNVSWRNSKSQHNNELYNAQAVSVLDKLGAINQSLLTEWIKFKELDPQHPKNSAIFDYLESIYQRAFLPNEVEDTFNYFRLNRQFNFGQISEIEKNIRFQCLELRDSNEIDFGGIAIPIRTKEMPFEILNQYKKHIKNNSVYSEVGDPL